METHTLKKTEEQETILNKASVSSDNLMINALAGCGKTSTLEMIEHTVDKMPILYLCFNKKNADEAKDRMLSTTTVRTFNSLGHRIWTAACAKKRINLNSKKTQDILRSIIEQVPKREQDELWASYWQVIQGVAMAKALGYVPEGKFPTAKRLTSRTALHLALDEEPDNLTADLIDTVLTASIQASYEGHIDFNDQIYMPALFGGTFPKFPIVMVDEAQDLSPVNHAMLERLVRSRFIGVGDPWQSIYQFRGAAQGGMDTIRERYNCTPLDLSVSFRCPSEIVRYAQRRVPHFKWFREGGHVDQPARLEARDFPDGVTIISRNNAPLFRTAMRFLSNGRSVTIHGSDIGPKLIATMRRLGPDELSREATFASIGDWLSEKLAKESKTAQDMADCMKVFASHGATLGQAIGYAEHLLKQSGTITFMTGHKSKGLEFDNVIHLDPWMVRKDPHNEQDLNLDYVITTRSRNRLTEIDSEHIQW